LLFKRGKISPRKNAREILKQEKKGKNKNVRPKGTDAKGGGQTIEEDAGPRFIAGSRGGRVRKKISRGKRH